MHKMHCSILRICKLEHQK